MPGCANVTRRFFLGGLALAAGSTRLLEAFLFGGNDSHNMLVPQAQSAFERMEGANDLDLMRQGLERRGIPTESMDDDALPRLRPRPVPRQLRERRVSLPAAVEMSANLDSGTRVRTVFRFSPRATVFAGGWAGPGHYVCSIAPGDGPDAEDVTSETLERALRYAALTTEWKWFIARNRGMLARGGDFFGYETELGAGRRLLVGTDGLDSA